MSGPSEDTHQVVNDQCALGDSPVVPAEEAGLEIQLSPGAQSVQSAEGNCNGRALSFVRDTGTAAESRPNPVSERAEADLTMEGCETSTSSSADAESQALEQSGVPDETGPLAGNLALLEPGTLVFTCNLCGAIANTPLDTLDRELISCSVCHSTPRTRALVYCLSVELFHRPLTLPEFPERPDIVGIGLSDGNYLAEGLRKKFSYTNTFYNEEPQLNIMEIDESQGGTLDFLISSEVFEHVPPPVSTAFVNARRLMKPGGLLLLTVPFYTDESGIAAEEHFPELHNYEVLKIGDDERVLVNRTADGRPQRFTNLVFHWGDEGPVIEMRRFNESSLLKLLKESGFDDVRVFRGSYFPHGVYWNRPESVPIVARAAR